MQHAGCGPSCEPVFVLAVVPVCCSVGPCGYEGSGGDGFHHGLSIGSGKGKWGPFTHDRLHNEPLETGSIQLCYTI